VSRTVAPYGTWTSPVTAGLLVEQAVRISQLQVDVGRVYWNEGRPNEAGRQVIVALAPGHAPVDVIPAGFSARSQVHEYGGRCYAVHGDAVVFSNWQDQRLWLVRTGVGEEPRPLTPEPEAARAERFADPVITPDGRWVICVHEHHGAAGQVDNELVAVPLDPPDPGQPARRLAWGHDFYAAPRLSPDGSRLAWITWDHPNMPWDHSELWVADLDREANLDGPVQVAGDPGVSITQPRWSPSGVLHYVSDRSGWWNLYDETGASLCLLDAEFGQPDWVFGNQTYGFMPDGELVAAYAAPGADRLGWVAEGRFEPIESPLFSHYAEVQPDEGAVFAIAGSPTTPPAVIRLDLGGGTEVLRRSRDVPIDDAAISVPQAVEFPTSGGQRAHALFFAPCHPGFSAPEGERPPLIVILHGGPTDNTVPVFNLLVQYWTSRGFAVADVDYRGSSGYGTEYRRRLNGAWGIADVEDCAHVVDWLAAGGLVDGTRAVIRGGSAGGFTTLAALAGTDTFAAGASLYGIADLELLARDTHKFESRYLDGLIGPWPQAADEYRRRSPIHHVEDISCPLILFQGLEDAVVPPAQSELMYEALRGRGVPVAYLAFEGEQHGFRQAATIIAVAQAELAFYGRVLGFTPDVGAGAPSLTIANEEKLSPRG
jgi:dipeptidyl aminopeptidase/acylaminoacyl peptidase